MSSTPSCGIDFGTSNSTVAVSVASGKKLVPLEDGKTTLPSAIFFKDRFGPIFGRAGIDAYMGSEDGRLMRGLKKILGTSLMDEKTTIGNRSVGFTEILQTFITHLKLKADEFAGESIENIVVGRPVHFHDNDDTADAKSQATLEKIMRDVGYKNVEFLYEPIAAAFAHEARIEAEKLSLVIDLGGGTSDFTIIKISNKNTAKANRADDIIATSGVRIGGTTFDYRLSLKSFMPALGMGTNYRDLFDKKKILPVPIGPYAQLSDWSLVNHAQTKKAIADTLDIKRRADAPDKIGRLLKLQQNNLGHALLGQVEKAKIVLTEETKHVAGLNDLGEDFTVQITRAGFENAISADVERVFSTISDCLKKAGIEKSRIELIVLTGGSTELPVINYMVREMFPHAAISQGDKMDSVGLGLAYRAGNIF